jgi:hypothetical protein
MLRRNTTYAASWIRSVTLLSCRAIRRAPATSTLVQRRARTRGPLRGPARPHHLFLGLGDLLQSASIGPRNSSHAKNLLAELNTNATEGGDALLPQLEKAAAKLNITLVYKAIEGSAEGLSKGGLIEIEETLDTPARCGVIAHELAHELLHKTNREGTTRQQRELEAESVAYAVLAHFGMHPQSCFYLATYDVTPEMLTTSLQTIGSAAKTIISLIDSTGQQIEEGQGATNDAPLPVAA